MVCLLTYVRKAELGQIVFLLHRMTRNLTHAVYFTILLQFKEAG